MNIDTTFLSLCIAPLERAVQQIIHYDPEDDTLCQIYQVVWFEEFEMIPEQCGKLLCKRFNPYFSSNKAIDELHHESLFHDAHGHDFIDTLVTEGLMTYYDHCNDTVDDDQDFVEALSHF